VDISPPCFFGSNDTLERLDSTCTVLGLFKKWDCPIVEHQLFPGDTLLLYTDGITESFNAAGEEFGESRVIEALRQYRDQDAKSLVASIAHAVRQHSPNQQFDDVTLIAAKCAAA